MHRRGRHHHGHHIAAANPAPPQHSGRAAHLVVQLAVTENSTQIVDCRRATALFGAEGTHELMARLTNEVVVGRYRRFSMSDTGGDEPLDRAERNRAIVAAYRAGETMTSVAELSEQLICVTFGNPGWKMSRPWLPPRLNFTGIALPAFATFSVGRLSTGWKNPEKLYPHNGVTQ